MSATMARQGGRVQLEQSDMHLALNMGRMAKEGFSCAAIDETQYLIEKPHAKIPEGKKQAGAFPGLRKVINKIEFCLGGLAPLGWKRTIIPVRDTPVEDYSAPGINSARRVPFHPLIAV